MGEGEGERRGKGQGRGEGSTSGYSTSKWRGPAAAVACAVGFYFLPHMLLLINSFTPLKVCHTQAYARLMDMRRSFYPESEPIPLPEIDYKDLTEETFKSMTNNIARPIVIRNLLDKDTLQELGNLNSWKKYYGNESVNCVNMSNETYKECTVAELINYNTVEKRNVYSRTNHYILYNRPELIEKIKNNLTEWVGSKPPLYEIFLGFKSGGSPLHAAFGVNLFKQIVGHKKWLFINPKWISFVNLHMSEDAASLLGIVGVDYSDAKWLRRVERYETIVGPGDAILNPCMWMHIVENLPGATTDSLVIGSPERHFGLTYGWRTTWFITSHLIAKKIAIKAYRALLGLPKEVTAMDFMPVVDATSAAKFDRYIRTRAQALTGEFQ